ncbi:MAG: GNAT family N-acetyltransferase [Chloroflexi bacterium]|nr:GNAT family N-acetyltransferase [Chloroflexota bacterium]
MQDLVIRPLAPSDIPAVSVAATSVGWSELEERLQYYLPMPQAQTLIVTYGEDPIGSGTAIAKGPVGWLGAVFIHPDYQGRGYGTLLTQALVAWLEERGCVSQALAATSEGERVYRKLGFSAESTYTVFGGRTLTQVPYHQYLRPLTDSDLNSVVELDRWATCSTYA